MLPAEEAGNAVLTLDGQWYRSGSAEPAVDANAGRLQFHAGRIGGALPQARGVVAVRTWLS